MSIAYPRAFFDDTNTDLLVRQSFKEFLNVALCTLRSIRVEIDVYLHTHTPLYDGATGAAVGLPS